MASTAAATAAPVTPDQVVTVVEFIIKLLALLGPLLSKDGTVTCCGRTIKFHIGAKVHHMRLCWYCRVEDVESNATARADNYASRKGALQHACANLAAELRARGVLR